MFLDNFTSDKKYFKSQAYPFYFSYAYVVL